jgi:methyl-accepting chemotaxis protein
VTQLSLSQPRESAVDAAERALDPKARSFFRRSTIQARLTLAFWIIGAMSLLSTLLAVWQIERLQERAMDDLRIERLAGELYAAASGNTVRALALASAGDPAVADLLSPEFRATGQRLELLHQELERATAAGAGSRLVQEAATTHQAYRDAAQAALAGRGATADAGARSRLLAALRTSSDAYVAAARATLAFHGGEGEGAAALEQHASQARRQLLWVFSLLTVVSVPFIVVLLVHVLTPMYVAVRIARKVADGDLTVLVRTGGSDEMARLMLALDDMTRSLRRIVGQVVRGAGAVAATGAQVRQGHLDLSQRTETQASTLQQTASSMEQLTATVSQNADHARQASELAASAAEVARQGGEVVGQVVHAMGGLSQSARKIEEISGVIDAIAFQTNILALNAAVEAARAGEQGRGFAVVAAEVRTLAQRSAAAAKEIKNLSFESVGKAQDGTRLVDAAGRTMGEIVTSVGRVSSLIAEIAAASEEQRSGIEQVNAAIGQMDQVVQQNAALVDQTGHSTEALHAQSAALLQAVAQFKLENEAREAAVPQTGSTEDGWMARSGTIAMGSAR